MREEALLNLLTTTPELKDVPIDSLVQIAKRWADKRPYVVAENGVFDLTIPLNFDQPSRVTFRNCAVQRFDCDSRLHGGTVIQIQLIATSMETQK